MKTKILYILPKAQQGGAETQLQYILRGIDHKKFDVHLGILYKSNELENEFASFKGVKTVDFHKRNKLDILVLNRIRAYAKKEGIDIIHALMGNHHAYVPALFLKNTLAIGGIMGTQYDELPWYEWMQSYVFEKFFCKQKNLKLVSCSHAGRDLYIRQGFAENSVYVVPNGFDHAKYLKGNASKVIKELNLHGKFVIGMVARLMETKNHRELIDAFQFLSKERNDLILLLVGAGELMEELQSYVRERELENTVIFTGNRKDVPDLLKAMDLFVFPSLSEGWPNVVSEAMTAGLPVIAYPAGDAPFIIEHEKNGIIVRKGLDELIAWMENLINNKELRDSLIKEATKTLEGKYSIEWMVKEYEKLYEEFLEHRDN